MSKNDSERKNIAIFSIRKTILIMKFSCIICITAILNVSAEMYSQSAKMSLHLKDGTLKEVFYEIEKQSDFNVFYNIDQIDVNKKVSIQADNTLISEVLDRVLTMAGASYTVMDKIIVIKGSGAGASSASFQESSAKGVVRADDTGESLPGVNIVIKGTSTGTITDIEGKFSLPVETEEIILVVSYVGYISQEISVKASEPIEIKLLPDIYGLDEIVVVGYGIEQKSLVTGAISKIKSDDIENTPAMRVEQALQGKTAGVFVLPNSGSPGSGMKVRIRGVSGNGNSDPLYIVDGLKTDNVEYLDPGDIESVEVLKDAASAAIYGAEGANGVILITTKSGKIGKFDVNYSFQYGLQSVDKRMRMMNAREYSTYLEEAGIDTIGDPGTDGTDWIDEVFETAPMQKHHLSFSGGNDMSTYLIATSYFSQDGIVGGEKANFNRYTARLNTDHKIKPWLEAGNRLSFSHYVRSSIAEDDEFRGIMNSTLLFDPTTPVVYEGNQNLPAHVQQAINDGQNLVEDENGNYYGLSEHISGEIVNPVALIDLEKGHITQDKILGNIYLSLKPMKGLSITSRLGVNVTSQLENLWEPSYYFTSERQQSTPAVRDNIDNWYGWQWENYATYMKKIGDHQLTALAGIAWEKNSHKKITTLTSGMIKEGDAFSQHGTAVKTGDITGDLTETRLKSYFGRLSYNYASKYVLEATLRRDGSSLFAENKRWGNFPSVSAGWILTNEEFWPFEFMDYLKLRASWGRNGSLSNVEPDQFRVLIETLGLKYPLPEGGFAQAAEVYLLANDNLTWETSQQSDIGIDLRTLSNKLYFSVDYYHKVTKDLLTKSTPAIHVGNDASFANAGDVTNKGFEFELGYREYDGEFHYDINLNLSTIKNKVTRLDPSVTTSVSGTAVGTGWTATYFEKDYPVWYFKGYETNGIFQNESQIEQYIAQNHLTNYNPQPGDPIIVNTNDDNLINDDDMTYIGDPHPSVVYGASARVEYKSFDLGLVLQGSMGNEILMGYNRIDRVTSNKPEFFYSERWTGDGSTNDWFRADAANKYAYNSDLMVFNGSYLRIKQIQLGFTLPATLTNKVLIKTSRIYVSLDDYFTFTKYPGLDPEAGSADDNSQGIDRGLYPIPRKFLVGISVSF